MLGWKNIIYRTIPPLRGLDDERLDAVVLASARTAVGDTAPLGTTQEVASWSAALYGIDWLLALAEAGKATLLLHTGYPLLWAFRVDPARDFNAREVDLRPPGLGHVVVTVPLRQILSTRDEWLVAEAWDQS